MIVRPLLRIVLAAGLMTACGTAPQFRTVPVTVVRVTIPQVAAPTETIFVSVRYDAGCGNFRPDVTRTARTASMLILDITTQVSVDPSPPCPPVYIEQTLEYADAGTPARSSPFEVIVNGKSWGTVQVK